jgi:hypothetical protein
MTDPEQGARTAMGLVMIAFVILGAALVSRTGDTPMAFFGYSLMAFGTAYVFGLIRQHYDAVDRAIAQAGEVEAMQRLAAE